MIKANEEHRSVSPTMSYQDWNRRSAAKEFIWTGNANHCLATEAANLSPGRALDLASGDGRNAVWLAEQGWAVRAVDFSAVAIEKARQLAATHKVADKIDFQVADVRGDEPEVHHFDLVVLISLPIQEAERAPVLALAAQAVAPGGMFLLVSHDAENLKHGSGGPQHPDVLFPAEQVVAALGGEREIEKAARVERPEETDSCVKVARDCLVRGKRR